MSHHSQPLGKSVVRRARELVDSGNLQAAKELLAPYCARKRRDEEAWLLLGLVNIQLSAWEEARSAYEQAARISPGMAAAHFGLGNALLGAERYDDAIRAYRRTLELKPDFAEALNNLGRACQLSGSPEAAIGYFERALVLNPNLAKTAYNLGLAYAASGKPADAVRPFLRALQLSPEQPEVLTALGRVYSDIGQLDLATECLEKVVRAMPDSAGAYCDLGLVNKFSGNLPVALDCFRRATALRPDYADAIAGEAATLDMLGEVEQAYQRVRRALDQDRWSPNLLFVYSNVCQHGNSYDEAIALIEEALQRPDCQGRPRTALLFGLGKLYDACKDYDRAFQAYAEANQSMTVVYDSAQTSQFVDQVIHTFSGGSIVPALDNGAGVGPIFIVGMPRSGTTLVEQILAGHPDVCAAGELRWISNFVAWLPQRVGSRSPFPLCFDAVRPCHLDTMAAEYRKKIEALAGTARFVTDKMPNNFLHLGLIRRLFPRAPIVHCIRDPMDTCLSIYFQYFDLRIPYSYNLTHIGRYYRDYIRLMRHWQQVIEPAIIPVSYAELVEQPESMVRSLLAAVGLEWEPECLEFAGRRKLVATASYDQVRRPLYKSSVARWRHYEQHLGELKAALEDDSAAGRS